MSAGTFGAGVLVGMFLASLLVRLEAWLGRREPINHECRIGDECTCWQEGWRDAHRTWLTREEMERSTYRVSDHLVTGRWPEPVPLDDGSDDA